jgi:hypothetical protein
MPIYPLLISGAKLTSGRHEFKGHLKDDWAAPSAHYEMATLDWLEKDLDGVNSKAKVLESEQWLMKMKNWGEPYLLETRMSFKISSSLNTIKRYRRIMGY